MKVKAVKDVDFVPVSINITFESLAEAQSFYNVFNHNKILSASGLTGNAVREALKDALGTMQSRLSDSWSTFANKLDSLWTRY